MVAVFVALMFIGFILLDLAVQKLEARRTVLALKLTVAKAGRQRTALPRGTRHLCIPIPEGVHLSEGHTWLKPEQGVFWAGADSLVARALGRVSRVIPPKVGTEVWTGSPLFQLELDGRALTVASPVSARVVSVNGELQDRPELVAQAPYDKGWVCALVPTRLAQEKTVMRVGTKAAAWLEREFDRFGEFLWARVAPDLAMGVTSQDGGVPAPGSLAHFETDIWNSFEREFLRPG